MKLLLHKGMNYEGTTCLFIKQPLSSSDEESEQALLK